MTIAFTGNTATTTTNTINWTNASTSIWSIPSDAIQQVFLTLPLLNQNRVKLPRQQLEVELSDGSILYVDALGNYRIDDKDAKVIYQANRQREFNPYINAGDMVARFIDFLGTLKPQVRKDEISTLPLQLFIHWLILEAASRDGDPIPQDITPLPKARLLTGLVRPRCLLPSCRRFIRRGTGFSYCNTVHARMHGQLVKAA